MSKTIDALLEQRNTALDEARRILDAAGERELTREQRGAYDSHMAQVDGIDQDIEAEQAKQERRKSFEEARSRNPLASSAGPATTERRARYGEPLTEGRGFADLEGVQAKDSRAFGDYVRSVAHGETRDALEGGTTTGGALVPVEYAAGVLDLTRNKLALSNAGARVIPLHEQVLKLARIDADPTPGWRNEAAAVATSDITFGQVTFTAKSLAVMVKASMELMEDAPNFGEVLSESLSAAFALNLDAAGLYGTGVSPVPQGIYTASGVNVTSMGTNGLAPANYDFVIGAVQRLRTKNFEPTGIVYSPRTEGELGSIKATTNEYLTPPAYLDGITRVSTSQVKTAQTQGTSNLASDMFVGDFSKVAIGLRTAFNLRVLRERYADTGEIGFLGWLRADIQLLRPAAFEVVTGIL